MGQKKLDRLTDALVENILTTSDEDVLAEAREDKEGRSTVYVTLGISEREGGGLRIRAMGDLREAYVSGANKDAVFADIGPVLQRILKTNHGIDWVKDES